ncbi:hypothetical protein A9Q93_02005 [Nonlabens dokdonensis]|uniref:Galanin n=1 Tax=Nonlabens dokdonensis TaxID=328515 RepID=A0A1Z8BBZ4_9FLAO|nr:DUF3137 domain-containing protein [Nonlabens dokdonensis]OUS20111.1 hypothetical protein A9Q93_02005 [Nonlabens dokdonensis]
MEHQLFQLLETTATQLEKKRIRLKRFYGLYNLTILPLNFLLQIATVVVVVGGIFFPPFWLWLILLFVVYIGLSFVPHPKESYHDYVKEDVLPQIFKEVHPNYEYHPFGINNEALSNSGFFNKSFFRNNVFIHGEDRVTGIVDNVTVDFTEVAFYRKDINWLKSFGGFILAILLFPIAILHGLFNQEDGVQPIVEFGFVRDTIKYYRGLFLYANFNKSFEGDVILIPKKLESNWDKFSDAVFGSSYSKMEIDNHTVSSNYSVYTTNAQMAYYVLSPSLINSIVQIIETEKVHPMISFRSGKMYMTIPWDRDYFSVDINEPVNGAAYFTNYIEDIKSFEKIIKHLKLDVKIWSKS